MIIIPNAEVELDFPLRKRKVLGWDSGMETSYTQIFRRFPQILKTISCIILQINNEYRFHLRSLQLVTPLPIVSKQS
jgi:hypothetical protein